jgi:phytoene dehydrogenase-like protein
MPASKAWHRVSGPGSWHAGWCRRTGFEAMDANLVGGDLGGGSNAWNRQLVFRPVFPYFRYRMPVNGLYLCSSYAHPGARVHGMCGYNAAERVVKDLGGGA